MDWLWVSIVVSLVVTLVATRLLPNVFTKHDLKRIAKVARSKRPTTIELPEDYADPRLWLKAQRKREFREWDMEFAMLSGMHYREDPQKFLDHNRTLQLAWLQRFLWDEGLFSGPRDGHWSRESQRALDRWLYQMPQDRYVWALADGSTLLKSEGIYSIKTDKFLISIGRIGDVNATAPRRLGKYEGDIDGVPGPRTMQALQGRFDKHRVERELKNGDRFTVPPPDPYPMIVHDAYEHYENPPNPSITLDL